MNAKTQTDRRIALPPPNYKVEQKVVGRGHQYHVTMPNGNVSKLSGCTGNLAIIAKPQLVNWAGNQAAEDIGFALAALAGNGAAKKVTLTEEWIEKVLQDARKKPEKMKTDAADLGTRCHEYFEKFIRGQAPEKVEADILPAVDAFNAWFKQSGLTIVAGDTKVAALSLGVGGALDALAMDESEDFVLLDYKTSNGIYDEYALQVALYAQAFEETYGIPIKKAVIVRFCKVPKYFGIYDPEPETEEYPFMHAYAEWAETKNGTGFVLRNPEGKRPLMYRTFASLGDIPYFTRTPEKDPPLFEVKQVADLGRSLDAFRDCVTLKRKLALDQFMA